MRNSYLRNQIFIVFICFSNNFYAQTGQAKLCQKAYVWLFSDSDQKRTQHTKDLATTVEQALTRCPECDVLRRTDLAKISLQIENEKEVDGSEETRKKVKSQGALIAVFGELQLHEAEDSLELILEFVSLSDKKVLANHSIFIHRRTFYGNTSERKTFVQNYIYDNILNCRPQATVSNAVPKPKPAVIIEPPSIKKSQDDNIKTSSKKQFSSNLGNHEIEKPIKNSENWVKYGLGTGIALGLGGITKGLLDVKNIKLDYDNLKLKNAWEATGSTYKNYNNDYFKSQVVAYSSGALTAVCSYFLIKNVIKHKKKPVNTINSKPSDVHKTKLSLGLSCLEISHSISLNIKF